MIRASQLGALSDALASVLPLAEPADATLRNFFRRHPGLGQRDRAFVAEGTFATLRRLRSLSAQARSLAPRSLAIAVTLRELGISLRDLEPVLTSDERTWAKAFKGYRPELKPAEAAELPDWLWTKLDQAFAADERDALVRSWL
jgi:16S rRNA (cytosine967-C5)-methyltransferase